ncbi:MAG: hypothetical protein ACXVR9_16850 [Gaiellaceae bacterium]
MPDPAALLALGAATLMALLGLLKNALEPRSPARWCGFCGRRLDRNRCPRCSRNGG